MKKFYKSPIRLFILITVYSVVFLSNKANGLGKPPANTWVSVSFNNGDENEEARPKINTRVEGNDQKYRYKFDSAITAFLNDDKRRGKTSYIENPNLKASQSTKVQVNPRGSSGFRNSDIDGISSKVVSNSDSLEWTESSLGFSNPVVTVPIAAGDKRIRRLQSVQHSAIITKPEVESNNPPPHDQVAKMARFIVKHSAWTSVATISSRPPTTGFPFASIFSVSDGPSGISTGVPYMYLTPLDICVVDLKENPKASLTMSLAQGDYCRQHNYDPEDPRCAHVILTGTFIEIGNSTEEASFARNAMFSRHPEMQDWPKDHGWFFAKLSVSNILVLDYFGGAKTVTPEDYFRANMGN